MILVALIALGLGGYRARLAAIRREKVERAAALLRSIVPGSDPDEREARLGAMNPGGTFQEVVFSDRRTGRSVTVTVPTSPRAGPPPAVAPPPPGRSPAGVGTLGPDRR